MYTYLQGVAEDEVINQKSFEPFLYLNVHYLEDDVQGINNDQQF